MKAHTKQKYEIKGQSGCVRKLVIDAFRFFYSETVTGAV